MDRISTIDAMRRGLLAYNPYIPRLNQMQARFQMPRAIRPEPEQPLDWQRMGAMMQALEQEEPAPSDYAFNTTPRDDAAAALAMQTDPSIDVTQGVATTPYGLNFSGMNPYLLAHLYSQGLFGGGA